MYKTTYPEHVRFSMDAIKLKEIINLTSQRIMEMSRKTSGFCF